MARKKPRSRVPQEPEEILGLAQRSLDLVRPYLKWIIAGGVALALALLGWSGYSYLKHSRETQARAALDQVRPRLSQPEQAEEAIKSQATLIQNYPATNAAQLARLFKAHLLYQTKKFAEATQMYEDLRASLKSGDPYGWGQFVTESLSYCYEAQGNWARAAQVLMPLVDQTSGNYQTVLLARLALLYDKAGDHKEASQTWQRLVKQAKNPALVSYWKERLAGIRAEPPKTDK